MSTPACQSYMDDYRDDSLRQSGAGVYIVVKIGWLEWYCPHG